MQRKFSLEATKNIIIRRVNLFVLHGLNYYYFAELTFYICQAGNGKSKCQTSEEKKGWCFHATMNSSTDRSNQVSSHNLAQQTTRLVAWNQCERDCDFESSIDLLANMSQKMLSYKKHSSRLGRWIQQSTSWQLAPWFVHFPSVDGPRSWSRWPGQRQMRWSHG